MSFKKAGAELVTVGPGLPFSAEDELSSVEWLEGEAGGFKPQWPDS